MVAQTVKTTTRQYTDLDLSFTKHPVTGDLAIKTGDNAVIVSVRNLIMTNFYERPFHPELGSGVGGMMFEPVTPITAQRLKREIEDVITNFEPRVRLVDVIVSAVPDSHSIQVSIKFYINNSTTLTDINVFLERTR